MTADETLRCADCGGELGMLHVMRGYIRLGHKQSPATLHPPRTESAPRSALASASRLVPEVSVRSGQSGARGA